MKKSRSSANISIYLLNDARESRCYYWMRIGNRTKAFEWYHIQWPWTTPGPDFKVTPLFDAKYLRHSYSEWTYALLNNVILNDLVWRSEIFNDTKHRAVSLQQLSFLFTLSHWQQVQCLSPEHSRRVCLKWYREFATVVHNLHCHLRSLWTGSCMTALWKQ